VCLMIYDVTDIASSKRALERANDQLAKLSMIDKLTGLFNRGTWENLLDAEFSRHRRYGGNSTLVMFDIDHFKAINDSFGHLVGDEVIRHTAAATRRHLRHSDSAGRYGGEEFAIILPETDTEGALTICERILSAISRETVTVDSHDISYTVSIGIAPLTDNSKNYMAWLEQADQAMYSAKQGGRNQIVTF